MSEKSYIQDLKRARGVLADFLREREEIEVKIARQKKKVAAWVELCDGEEFSENGDFVAELIGAGLTDVCITAMRASYKEWMTIAEILEVVGELGFPLHQYKAPAASITTTVNRLVESKEVVASKRSEGANEYKFIGKDVAAYRNAERDALLRQGNGIVGKDSSVLKKPKRE